jgi:hypothetical protein
MKKAFILLMLGCALFSLSGCGEEKEINQTDLTAEDVTWADIGQGEITFNLANAALSEKADASCIEMDYAMAGMSVVSFTRLSSQSFRLALSGRCDTSKTDLAGITLLAQGVENGNYDYLKTFLLTDSPLWVKRSGSSSSSAGGKILTVHNVELGLHNGGQFIPEAVNTAANVAYKTSDEAKHPLSNLSPSSFSLSQDGDLQLSYGAIDGDLSGYSLEIAATANSLGMACSFSLA